MKTTTYRATLNNGATHHFESPSETDARNLCEAMDWIYHGPARETAGPPPEAADEAWKKGPKRRPQGRPLTTAQVRSIAITARQAFDNLEKHDLIEAEGETKTARFDLWRRQIMKEITGQTSLNRCQNSHYRPLKEAFLKLAGKPHDAPEAHCHGPQNSGFDTMEKREELHHLIRAALEEHRRVVEKPRNDREAAYSLRATTQGGILGEHYLLAIARNQTKKNLNHLGDLIILDASHLQRLLYTVRNRIAAREGRGQTENRNKSQRKNPPTDQ